MNLSEEEAAEEPRSATPAQKRMLTILVAIAFVVLFGVYRYVQRDIDSEDARKAAYQTFAEYDDEMKVRRLVDKHHDRCFSECYDIFEFRRHRLKRREYFEKMQLAIESDLGP